MDIDNTLQIAFEHYKTGMLIEAESLCKEIISREPLHVQTLLLLGSIHYQLQADDYAISHLSKALEIDPDNAEAFFNLGIVFHNKGLLGEAIAHYQKALVINPCIADAHYNLGTIFQERNQYDDAIVHYRKSLEIFCDIPDIYHNLGTIFQKKRNFEEAIAHYLKALELKPDLKESLSNLGTIFLLKKDFNRAIHLFQKALELNPADAGLYVNLGNALKDSFRLDESIMNYEKALYYNAECPDAYNGMGVVLKQRGQIEKTVPYFLKAIQLKPDFAEAHNNLGMVYEAKGLFDEALSCYQKAITINPAQADIYNNLGNLFKNGHKIKEAESFYRISLQKNPDNSYVHSNLVFVLNYSHNYDAGTIFAEHLTFAKQFEAPLLSKILPHYNDRDAGRRLRIGYVSADFRRHSVNYFLAPALASHNHDSFEVFCYSDVMRMKPDKVTEMLKRYADHWEEIAGLSDEHAAKLIRKDRIDILVDLAGHTGHNRMLLFARKPAPVQVSWLGYPNTTGLSSIDYRIVDGYTDPPGMTDPYYTEKLMRMPESFLCYSPAGESPPVSHLPAMTAGHITFGSFNILAKVSPITIELWSAILKKIPSACLLMKTKSFADQSTCEYTKNLFARQGIEPKRIELLSRLPSYGEHLATYNRIDIALDTSPYNGTTTTCEALWMGVPIVTLAGDRHAARVGMSLLTNIGLPELVAKTPDEYVNKAANLANDIARLRLLRESLRDIMRRSPVCDAKGFTSALELHYRRMWEEWVTER